MKPFLRSHEAPIIWVILMKIYYLHLLGGSGNYTIPSSFLTNFDTLDRRLEVFLTEEDDRYYVTKFWDEINESDGGTTSVDFPIIRFADILLMYGRM